MQYVYHEPDEYGFKGQDGHDAKFFGTESPRTQHLIVECHDQLRVTLTEHESEFNYYVLEGSGYFDFDGNKQAVAKGDLVVVPPNTTFTYGGQLRMLLISTPKWTADQEDVTR